MRTLTFPHIRPYPMGIPHNTGDNFKYDPTGMKNGLWISLMNAYNEHAPLILRPDDIYNTVCCIWAKYIIINAEVFRKQIVTHEGQKELKYLAQHHVFTQENLATHFDAFIDLIQKDGNKSINWMKESFSTTEPMDKLIRAASTLASQKKYYKYTSRTMCGFPSITLEGTVEDWTMLFATIRQMPTYDAQMADWQTKLLLVINKFIEANETDIDFWQAPFTVNSGGSGSPTTYKGWATVFTPFVESGRWNVGGNWYKTVSGEVLDLTVDFKIQLNNDMDQHYADLLIYAGPTRGKILDGKCTVQNIIKHEVKYI